MIGLLCDDFAVQTYFETHWFTGYFHSSVASANRNYVPHSSMITVTITVADKKDAAEGQTYCFSFCLPGSFRCMMR